MEQLLALPDHTLGKELALYLQKKELCLIPGYLRHDCKHILFGYEMDEEGEARMQLYFLGNRHYSLPVVTTALMCLVFMPDHWKKLYREFKRGRKVRLFKNADFEQLISMRTETIRKQFGISLTNQL
jgi:ubiquinone biosynthesis protein Coq4